MSDKPENPPAFACAAENGHQEGMTLRDYFAAAVMTGWMANSSPECGDLAPEDAAAHFYKMTDAMLKARAA